MGINIEIIRVDKDGDLLFCTVGLYKLFLSQKGGHDAFQLYIHLMFTARLQETNQVWAKNSYLMKGLGMGTPRLKKAKALLKKLGLVEYVQSRKNDGTMGEVYIKMNFITREPTAGIVTAPPVSRPTGASRQMLKMNKENALKEKKNKTRKLETSENPLSEDLESNESDDRIGAKMHRLIIDAAKICKEAKKGYLMKSMTQAEKLKFCRILYLYEFEDSILEVFKDAVETIQDGDGWLEIFEFMGLSIDGEEVELEIRDSQIYDEDLRNSMTAQLS